MIDPPSIDPDQLHTVEELRDLVRQERAYQKIVELTMDWKIKNGLAAAVEQELERREEAKQAELMALMDKAASLDEATVKEMLMKQEKRLEQQKGEHAIG